MPTPEQVGVRWVHPKTEQVRYYVEDFRERLGIDAPKQVKVWMDRFGKVHVPYCDDKDLEIEIIRKLDNYMRGNRNVVGAYNADTCFTVIPSGKYNKMSYDNIESAKNRILALRKEGFHVLRIIRSVEGSSQVYRIIMSDLNDGRYTPGYQEVDDIADAEWMNYHGEYVWKYCA